MGKVMKESGKRQIGVVMVLFNPSEEDLDNMRHVATHYRGCVVDNSATPSLDVQHIHLMDYIPLRRNAGIAHAQNVAIRRLLEDNDVDYLVFFDQDSRFDDDYPDAIAAEYDRISNNGTSLAALGPTVVRKDNGEAYRSVIHRTPVTTDGFTPLSEIISSGCCISREALCRVGLNEERLFIDFVDCEWCWRARRHGLVSGTTPNITIGHKVGQRELHLGSHVVIISAPFRYYYQYRNLIWLSARGYVPWRFKVAKGVKFFLRLLYFPFFVRGGAKRWVQMMRGVRDGIWGLFTRHKDSDNEKL